MKKEEQLDLLVWIEHRVQEAQSVVQKRSDSFPTSTFPSVLTEVHKVFVELDEAGLLVEPDNEE